MTISADNLLDRMRLKGQVRKWRNVAAILALLLLSALIPFSSINPTAKFVARINITGIIQDDSERSEILKEIAENDNIKAVIVHVDSPGGTAVGGEELQESIATISAVKPVVATMGNMATSAGYLIIADVERIFARQASITGSIGVLIQTPNIKELADKIGVKMDTIKTGPLKDTPSLFEDMTTEGRNVMQGVVDSFYGVFVKIVSEGRKMPVDEVKKLADGRIYTGIQAVENGLVDEIGGDDQALDWLVKNKGIAAGIKIKDVPLEKPKNVIEEFTNSALSSNLLIPKAFSLQGLLSIWQKGAIN